MVGVESNHEAVEISKVDQELHCTVTGNFGYNRTQV